MTQRVVCQNRWHSIGDDFLVDRSKWFVYDSQSKTDANGHPTDDAGNLIRRYLHGPGVDEILAEDVVTSGSTTETY